MLLYNYLVASNLKTFKNTYFESASNFTQYILQRNRGIVEKHLTGCNKNSKWVKRTNNDSYLSCGLLVGYGTRQRVTRSLLQADKE